MGRQGEKGTRAPNLLVTESPKTGLRSSVGLLRSPRSITNHTGMNSALRADATRPPTRTFYSSSLSTLPFEQKPASFDY